MKVLLILVAVVFASGPLWAEEIRFAVISDLNGSYGSTTYSQNVKNAVAWLKNSSDDLSFVLSTGDMVAGQKSNLDYRAMWQAFHKEVTTPLQASDLPLYPSPGNHDASLTRQVERDHYEREWTTGPVGKIMNSLSFVEGVSQNYPFQYAFRKGSGLFIALDSTVARPLNQHTLQWLEQVLQQENSAGFKVIFGHIPLLPFAFRKTREFLAVGSTSFADDFESLLERHNVDVFLSGHSHVYYPGHRNRNTQWISVPLLGGGPRSLLTHDNTAGRSQHGFLIIQYKSNGEWRLERRSPSGALLRDSTLPSALTMPTENSSSCRYCSNFPSRYFVDPAERVLYYKR